MKIPQNEERSNAIFLLVLELFARMALPNFSLAEPDKDNIKTRN